MACYMIQSSVNGSFDGVPVKIGTSKNVEKLMLSLQGAHHAKMRLMRTFIGGVEMEYWLHKHFAPLRLSGEWFSYDPEMLTVEPPMKLNDEPVLEWRDDLVFTAANREDLIMALKKVSRVLTEVGSSIGVIPGEVRKQLLDASHDIQKLTLFRREVNRQIRPYKRTLSLVTTSSPISVRQKAAA